jgi:uncharacterized protein (TIGR02996 family)
VYDHTIHTDDLLAAIWAAPWDDVPRLVYADAIERELPARAEFIRVQCGLASASGETRDRLERAERDLWQRNRREFRKGLPDRFRGQPFVRGFARPLFTNMSSMVVVNKLLPLFPTAPAWVIAINHAQPADLVTLYAQPDLVRVESLEVTHHVMLPELVASPYCTNLVHLSTPYTNASAELFEQIGPAMPNLRRLELRASQFGDGAARVAACELATRLERLDLSSNRLDRAQIAKLFGTGRFGKLASLDLSYLEDEGVALGFIASAQLPALEHLRLRWDLGDATARALAHWSGARTLKTLTLYETFRITADGLRALLDSPHLAELDTLTINSRAAAPLREALAARFPRSVELAPEHIQATRL